MARPTPQTPPRLFGWRSVVVCVVVGVVVNVGVAWGWALWGQARTMSRGAATLEFSDTEAGRSWTGAGWTDEMMVPTLAWPPDGFEHPSSRPATRISVDAWSGYTHVAWSAGGTGSFYRVAAMRCGWPMESLTGFAEIRRGPPALLTSESWVIDTGIAINSDLPYYDTARLPLRPIFPGFIVNTLFYASLVFAPVVGARVVRRRRRAKRGLCIACGYEVGGIAVCPECGVSATARVPP